MVLFALHFKGDGLVIVISTCCQKLGVLTYLSVELLDHYMFLLGFMPA